MNSMKVPVDIYTYIHAISDNKNYTILFVIVAKIRNIFLIYLINKYLLNKYE